MNNFLVLGSLFPEEMEAYILSKYIKKDINLSNVLFERKVVAGLIQNDVNICVISAPPVGEFPHSCKKPFFKEKANKSNYILVKYYTIFPLIHFFKYHSLKKAINRFIKKQTTNNDKTTIIIPEMHFPYLKVIKYVKKKFDNVKAIVIVPDLPQFSRRKTKSFIYNRYKNYIVKKSYDIARSFSDAFIFFSENMRYFFSDQSIPFFVIPGIQDSYCFNVTKKNIRIFLYSGKITRENGVFVLLDAFVDFVKTNNMCELIFIGDGFDFAELSKKSQGIKNVKVIGKKSHSEVVEYYKKSDCFVSPRLPTGDYVNYSFPSKILDYLATGKPTISFDLPCYSDEIRNLLFIPKKCDSNSLSNLFKQITKERLDFERIKEKQLSYINKINAKSFGNRIISLCEDCENE